jgi:DNA-binding helix-hairpin-helix protein with protein kinase domain
VVQPLPRFVELGHSRKRRRLIILVGLSAEFAALLLLPIGRDLLSILFIATLVIAFIHNRLNPAWQRARTETEQALKIAETSWAGLVRQWQELDSRPFDLYLSNFEKKRAEYVDLDGFRERSMTQLRATVEQRQRQQFLDSHRIDRASIDGIGPTRVATLQSYGIETAADVNERAIANVPGFGPVLTENLVLWRRRVERRFTYSPARGIDPGDIAALDQKIAGMRTRLERELVVGPVQLREIHQKITTSRAVLEPTLQPTLKALVQAEANRRAL